MLTDICSFAIVSVLEITVHADLVRREYFSGKPGQLQYRERVHEILTCGGSMKVVSSYWSDSSNKV